MEDSTSKPLSHDGWSAEFARQLEAERERLESFSNLQRGQFDGLESALAGQVENLLEQLEARLRGDHELVLEDVARDRARLQARLAEVESQAEKIRARRRRTKIQRRRLAKKLAAARKARSPSGSTQPANEQWRRLRAERDDLATRLHEAETRLHQQPSDHEHHQELEELRARLERASSELRDLKRRQAEHPQQSPSARPGITAGQPLDWETQKQMLLASLEADAANDHDDHGRQDRLTIDGTIRITDAVVAEKDREITDLKQLLAAQSQSVGDVAVGAAALGEIFDSDEIVCQERERLQQLQSTWEEKLRAAEIEISQERAKIARERAEIDEKRRTFTSDVEDRAGQMPPTAAEKKAGRGRWLSRLGLKDEEPGG
jgi:hypothetical protein